MVRVRVRSHSDRSDLAAQIASRLTDAGYDVDTWITDEQPQGDPIIFWINRLRYECDAAIQVIGDDPYELSWVMNEMAVHNKQSGMPVGRGPVFPVVLPDVQVTSRYPRSDVIQLSESPLAPDDAAAIVARVLAALE